MKVTRRTNVNESHQWFKNGDHPDDNCGRFTLGEFKGELMEGNVVRYYRHPEISGDQKCPLCGDIMHNHGWLELCLSPKIVCPGDFIITLSKNKEYNSISKKIFHEIYQQVNEEDSFINNTFANRFHGWLINVLDNDQLNDLNVHMARFMEESFEAMQALNMPKEAILKILEYVYSREPGPLHHELGGTLTTLTALVNHLRLDINELAEDELIRNMAITDQIKNKNNMKPNFFS